LPDASSPIINAVKLAFISIFQSGFFVLIVSIIQLTIVSLFGIINSNNSIELNNHSLEFFDKIHSFTFEVSSAL